MGIVIMTPITYPDKPRRRSCDIPTLRQLTNIRGIYGIRILRYYSGSVSSMVSSLETGYGGQFAIMQEGARSHRKTRIGGLYNSAVRM
jgi:ppGpp synthetase/RelA/SpoT-type nucleotidyltranferase